LEALWNSPCCTCSWAALAYKLLNVIEKSRENISINIVYLIGILLYDRGLNFSFLLIYFKVKILDTKLLGKKGKKK
jgi:hypothetical protein